VVCPGGGGVAPGLIWASTTPSLTQGIEFSHIRRNPAFWHLINTHFLGCAGHAILLVHIVSIAILRGTQELKAAGLAPILALPRHRSGVILAKSAVIKRDP
jgi:hypothetical protein